MPTDHTPESTSAQPSLAWYQFGRGTGWALLAIGTHLLGSLALTALGILTVRALLPKP